MLALFLGTMPSVWLASYLEICATEHQLCALLLSFILPFSAFLFGLYTKVASPFSEFKRQYVMAMLMAALLAGPIFLYERDAVLPHLFFLAVSLGTNLFLMPLLRSNLRHLLSQSEWWLSEVLVLNQSVHGTEFCTFLKKHPEYGLLFREEIPVPQGRIGENELLELKARYPKTLVLLLTDTDKRNDVLIRQVKRVFSHVILLPLETQFQASFFETVDLGLAKGFVLTQNLWNPRYIALKRCVDLGICFVFSVALVPLVLLIAIAIRLDTPGPILYRQTRVGQFGKSIRIFKFRTMIRNADDVLDEILENNPQLKAEWLQDHKLRNDPRVTAVGAFLRKLSLDEIPQFINIFLGEMSLVGPRPIVAEEKEKYGAIFEEYCVVRPGLTGLWQVSGRNDTRYEERVAYDHLYISTWSPSLDLWILARTVPVVLSSAGAY